MKTRVILWLATAALTSLLVFPIAQTTRAQQLNLMSGPGPRSLAQVSVMRGNFRVTLTGFTVTTGTTESVISTDGAGDEVYVLVNFGEVWAGNQLFGALQRKQSLLFGDLTGHTAPVAITGVPLNHPGQPTVVKAGDASPTGGLRSGNTFPIPGQTPIFNADGRPANAATLARVIPMVLWEGELRSGGRDANGIVLIPTIWENDNVPDVLNVWNRQVDAFIRTFAATSSGFVTGATARPLVTMSTAVLSTVPQRNDFDRPIGMTGDPFVPGSAAPNPATFAPGVMFLTFNSARLAATSTANSGTRGVVEIKYADGQKYGPGNYTIFLLIEQLP